MALAKGLEEASPWWPRVKPGVIGKDMSLSPEGGEIKNIISSAPAGLLIHSAAFTPGFTGGHKS